MQFKTMVDEIQNKYLTKYVNFDYVNRMKSKLKFQLSFYVVGYRLI